MRIEITIVGNKVKLDVFNARNVIIEREATFDLLNRFISSIAFNPSGVAAFPNPNIFAVIFDKIYPIAGSFSGISGNILLAIGLIKFNNIIKMTTFFVIYN